MGIEEASPTPRGDRSDVPGPGGRFTLCWCCGPRKVPPEPAISTPKTGSTVSERTSCQGSASALRGACQAAVLPRCPLAPCAQAGEGFRGKGPRTRGAWGASFLSASSSLVIMPFAETGRETGVGCADPGLLHLAWAPWAVGWPLDGPHSVLPPASAHSACGISRLSPQITS